MDSINKKYNASLDELQDLLGINEEALNAHGATMKNIMNINIAVEEIFVNVCKYAYEGKENKGVEVDLSFDGDVEIITFIDEGMPFDPLNKVDPNINAPIEERNIGGLGIYMVKKSMDKCDYKFENNKNIFRMEKNIKN